MFIKFATKQTFLSHTHWPFQLVCVFCCAGQDAERSGKTLLFLSKSTSFFPPAVSKKWMGRGFFFAWTTSNNSAGSVKDFVCWAVVTDDDWMRIGLGVLWSDFLLDSSQFGEKSKRGGSKRGVGRIFTPRVLQVRLIFDRLSKQDWNEMIHQVNCCFFKVQQASNDINSWFELFTKFFQKKYYTLCWTSKACNALKSRPRFHQKA